jgi:hypothetical protein
VALNDELFACAVTGKPGPIGGAQFLNALAASIVVELAMAGRLEIADDGEVVIRDTAPTGDPIADEVLAGLPEALDAYEQMGRGRTLAAVAPGLVKAAYSKTYDRATADGLVDVKKDKLLGVISREKHELTAAGLGVRDRVAAVLTGNAEPTPRDAALVNLVAAAGIVDRQVAASEREGARARAEALGRDDAASAEIAAATRSVKATAASLARAG